MTLNMYSPVGCKCLAVDVYLFKHNNRNTRKMCENSSKLTIKTSERRQ